MKILVTGGAGFIGSHVVDAYVAAGHDVVILDNLSTGRLSNINKSARLVHMDIRDQAIDAVIAEERPEVINHHAAQTEVRRSVAEPLYDAEVNILGSLNLLESAVRHRVRKFIYISSGGAIYGEPVRLPCDESHPVDPLCPYGASKHTVEHYLYLYHTTYNLDYTILRYANVYGPRQDPYGEAGVVAIFANQMLGGRAVTINGNGEQIRDFVYVTDCARANGLALHRGSGQAFNIGVGRGTTINEIYREIRRITGCPQEAVYGPAKAGETFKIYLDASKAGRELEWQPTVQLEDGLDRTVTFFRERPPDRPI